MKKILLLLLCYCSVLTMMGNQLTDTITVTKIWDKEKHNGFPDLYYFNNEFYCSFREAFTHVDTLNVGKVRIIKSKDTKNWQTVALFEIPGVDVREARLSTTPEGNLMAIVAAGVYKKGGYVSLAPYVSFSDKKGTRFSNLEKAEIDPAITPSLDWIWRLTWNKGIGYGVMYQVVGGSSSTKWEAHVLRTTDGRKYTEISRLAIDGNPNESTIRFDKNRKMYILVRREAGDKKGILTTSEFPYTQWNSDTLDYRLGGPNFLFLNEKNLCVGSRFYDTAASGKNYTSIYITDLHGKRLKTLQLPSGGDTGYPGMLLHGKNLWVAYYSGHEGKASIYLAKIPLNNLKLD